MFPFLHLCRCYCKKPPPVDTHQTVNDVVISLTTTPPRIQKIWPTIHSLLLQSQLPSKIYLWIPKHYKRFNNTSIPHIPEFLNHPLIQVERIDKDWGPATKLLPALEKFKDLPETKIIVVDDDRVYPPELISTLIIHASAHPKSAITLIGTDIKQHKRIKYKKTRVPYPVDVLMGHGGYLVKPKFFSPAVFDYSQAPFEAFFEDDVWLSGHLFRNTISRLRVPSKHPATQNLKLLNVFKFSNPLCRNENQNGLNFLKVWSYFLSIDKK